MACNHPKEEWTISTETDNAGAKGLLVFCVSLDGTSLTGEVTELPVDGNGNVTGAPVYLCGDVKGSDEPLPGAANLSLMTFNFLWRNTRVMLAGVRFRGATPNTFKGRFSAFSSMEFARAAAASADGVSLAAAPPLAPGDGDTGTGTGTQT
jgi:hypothetical protein